MHADPQDDPQGRAILSPMLAEAGAREALERRCAAISEDLASIAALHAAQPWRLVDRKTASRHLSYRRVFDAAGLAGLRIEAPHVFDDTHHLLLDLIRDGTVDGLRIGHIDALADPLAYLERLRTAVGPDLPIFAEKILEKNEPSPGHWPITGTTGDEFMTALSDALTDEQEGGRLERAFQPLRDENHRGTHAEERQAAKRQMLTDAFEGEARRVAMLAKSMADQSDADLSRTALSEAICSMIVALPVYRTYTTQATGAGPRDRRLLSAARQEAQAGVRPEVREAIDFIWELLIDDRRCATLRACPEFRIRFQQLSGAIAAKALEDTLFYRENAFIALNEAGSNPGRQAGGIAAFHAAMQARAKSQPHSLSATMTHHMKRGEDARARLYALSEAPDSWITATQHWAPLNAGFQRLHAGRIVPEPDVEWLIYQSLAGAWPRDGATDRSAMEALREEMSRYSTKALREAKIRSDWTRPDLEYEQKVAGFIDDLFAHEAFLVDFAGTLAPFIASGLVNSLAQTLLKLTAPGIPDIHESSECGDFSLIPQDNGARRERASLHIPHKPEASPRHFPDYKQWLTTTVLAARQRQPESFAGPYIPLDVSDGGRQVLAFLRGTPQAFALVVTPRLTYGKTGADTLLLANGVLDGLHLAIPPAFAGRTVRSELDGRTFTLGRTQSLTEAFGTEPLGLFLGCDDEAAHGRG